ncbi:MAG: response regulator transcription factor [Chloroflexi bacterium]|nr:response regulator transcription factor [Chloroflexota bacterium]
MHRILIVDDDEGLCKFVRVNLEARGYLVDEAHDGLEAMEQFKEARPDLVLLDVTMPNMNGIDLTIWLRAQSMLPIVVLSGHDEEDLKVRALDAGADDYVTKPFGYDELMARVRANLRRVEQVADVITPDVVEVANLRIDLAARRVFLDEHEIALTQTEFVLLAELAREQGHVVSHAQLLTRAWGPEYRDSSHYLYIYFGRIRKKLGEPYSNLIETVPRLGYMLRRFLPTLQD